MNQTIIFNILKKIQNPNLVDQLVDKLSFSELQSILLNVYDLKTEPISGSELLREYDSNRFVKPSDIDPIIHRKLDLKIFSLLPGGFKILELSPLQPIGTTSALTTVHQNNIVSTIRNSEVAADTTNVLALECAVRRRQLLKVDIKSNEIVKLSASQCLTRAQSFENKKFSASFNVFALCTAGRTLGNDLFEENNLLEHIDFYIRVFDNILYSNQVKRITVKLYTYDQTTYKLTKSVQKRFKNRKKTSVTIFENSDFGKNYYHRLRFMISVMNHDDLEFDYVDGGFTTWTSQLLNNQKERLMTSGIGIDFLLRTMKVKT
jgi:hypothetical protein